jgi:hypothetical protein
MANFVRLAHSLFRGLTDPYRPERHYMRGPGPKWRAKHDRPVLSANAPSAIPLSPLT